MPRHAVKEHPHFCPSLRHVVAMRICCVSEACEYLEGGEERDFAKNPVHDEAVGQLAMGTAHVGAAPRKSICSARRLGPLQMYKFVGFGWRVVVVLDCKYRWAGAQAVKFLSCPVCI